MPHITRRFLIVFMGGEIEICHKLYENYEQWSIWPESNGYIAYKYVYIAHYFALIWINIYIGAFQRFYAKNL